MKKGKTIPPIHPGEVLSEEFLLPMKISQYRIAKAMGVPARRINEIVKGKRAVTADTALRLGKFFGMEAEFWMNLQARYDLVCQSQNLAGTLKNIVTFKLAS